MADSLLLPLLPCKEAFGVFAAGAEGCWSRPAAALTSEVAAAEAVEFF